MKKRLLSFVLAVLMIASLLPATALAADIVDSGTCGAEGDGSNLTWTLDSEGVLTISGNGAMHDYDYSSPWHENGNQIQSVFMANGVTSIGNFAFFECISLTSMTIPDSVTCIGNCAFKDCSSLASVTIPDSVASIGVYAFCGCTSLKSVTIPDSVTSIGDYAFGFCTSLTGIWVDGGSSHYFSDASGVLFNKDKTVLAQCPGAFSGSYVIPDGVTSINDAAFVNCTSLTSVTIPDGVTNIGYEVFAGCTSLANMVLPNGVTRIGAEAFEGCTSMKNITIPDGVTSIGYDAFLNCKSLANVYFTGTEEAWNGITIDGGNDALKNAKIHCNYVSHTHNYKDVVTAPTCTEKGYTTHTCACGDSYVDTYVDALGHAWDNGKVTKKPTEAEDGVKAFTCTRCGETKTETIPKLTHEHSYDAVVTAPTCTEKSYTTHTCACGDSYVDTYVDAFGHAWDNGKVTKEPTETETGVKTFTCTRCGETKTDVIPATGVVDSGTCGAEGDGSNLTWTLDSEGVLTISGSGDMHGYGPSDAPWHGRVKSAVIADGVTSIGASAFCNCTSLTSVAIPDSVTSIGSYAFCNCTSLTSVTIPDSVTSIGDGAFASCTSLTGIWVAEGNNDYSSDASGVLFNKDKTTLVQCPGAFREYAIPDSVTSICNHAFYGCESLTSVTIPNSVTSIGSYAFYNCTSLTDVYYAGSEAQWKAISISSNGNDDLLTANIHYNYGSHTHSYKAVVTAPTCTEKGYTTHTCACGDSYVDTYVDALGHAWDNGKVTKQPTETETGTKTFTCTRCGETKTETIPKLTHEHSYKAVVTAPTCTAKGYTTHTCACGDSYVDTYVDALGHAWDNGKVTKQPTETETGVKTFTCTRCGETKTETIPKLAHEHSYKAVVTAPTCTEKGYTTHTCACGDSYVDSYVLPLGHDWGSGKVTKEPTATENGIKTYICARCGETKTEVIPAGGCPSAGFTDVPGEDNWAHAGIDYCVANGLMSGVGGNLFAPKKTTTRAQIVQILYNLEGEPRVYGSTPFTDLTNDWYKDAILWAYQTGVVAGTSGTTFDPDLPVTREQIAVILMEYTSRVLGLKNLCTPADLSRYPDAGSVSDWAKNAMADAVALGLISGASNGGQTCLEPQGSATREQVATILMEFCKNVKK